jgi:hypothetical protein
MRKKRQESEEVTVRVCSVEHDTAEDVHFSITFSHLPCPECWQRPRDLGSAFRKIPLYGIEMTVIGEEGVECDSRRDYKI